MGCEKHGKSCTTQKAHGDYGGKTNAIIVFNEGDPEPKIIEVDPAEFRGLFQSVNRCNLCQNSCKNVIEVIVADAATTTEVAEAATNTDAATTHTTVVIHNNPVSNIECAKILNRIHEEKLTAPVMVQKATNTDNTKSKSVEISTEVIHVANKEMVTDAVCTDVEICTDIYTADMATIVDFLNKATSTKTKRCSKVPSSIKSFVKNKEYSEEFFTKPDTPFYYPSVTKMEDKKKACTSKVIAIKLPVTKAASSDFIQVSTAEAGVGTTKTTDDNTRPRTVINSLAKNIEDSEEFFTKPDTPFYNPAIKSSVTKMKYKKKACASKVITIKSPATEGAPSTYIPVPKATTNDKTSTTGPRTAEISTDTYIIPHKVASKTKLVYPKYTDTREAAIKAVCDIAATAEQVATTKVASNDAVTKENGTKLAKDRKTFNKNVAVVTVGSVGTVTSSSKTESKTSLKARKQYPSSLSSSEDDDAATFQLVATKKVAANDAPTKEIDTKPARDLKKCTKRAGKTEFKTSLKARKHYPSSLSSSEDNEAATVELVATKKVAANDAPTKEIGTEPAKNVAVDNVGTVTSSKRIGKTESNISLKARKHYYPSSLSSSEEETKNVAVDNVGTLTFSKRAGKTESVISLKARKHYLSSLSSSEEDTIHNCYIIYPSIV